MGYRMKGFSGFKPSPAKVSNQSVVDAQDKLDKIELSHQTPGWAKVLGQVFSGGKSKSKEKTTEEKIKDKAPERKTVKTDFIIEGIDDTKNKLKRIDTTDINVFNK